MCDYVHLFLLAGISVSQAVRCYVCNSAHGNGCGEDLDYQYISDCPGETCSSSSIVGGYNGAEIGKSISNYRFYHRSDTKHNECIKS